MSNPIEPIPLSDYQAYQSVIAMFYGPSGSGKTEIGGTCPDALIINTGRGLSTLKSPGFKQRHPNANPLIVDISEALGERGFVNQAVGFDRACDVIDESLQRFGDRIKSVVLDDLTNLRRYALNKGIEVNSLTDRSKTLQISKKLKVHVLGVQDFGIEMSLIQQFIAGYVEILQRAGKHFIVLAHERTTYKKADQLGQLPSIAKIRPAVTGEKFPDDIPQFFDVIGHCGTMVSGDKRVHRVRFNPDNIILAKNRWGGVTISDTSKETYDASVSNFNFADFVTRVEKSQHTTK